MIPNPEIRSFKIQDNYDFILIGCDGIFEKMKNQEILKTVFSSIQNPGYQSVHERCGKAVDAILNECVE